MNVAERFYAAEKRAAIAYRKCINEIDRRIAESDGTLYWVDLRPVTPTEVLVRRLPDGTTKEYGFAAFADRTLKCLLEDEG